MVASESHSEEEDYAELTLRDSLDIGEDNDFIDLSGGCFLPDDWDFGAVWEPGSRNPALVFFLSFVLCRGSPLGFSRGTSGSEGRKKREFWSCQRPYTLNPKALKP